MNKMAYESPEMDIRYFDVEDVISVSWVTEETPGGGIVDDDWGDE